MWWDVGLWGAVQWDVVWSDVVQLDAAWRDAAWWGADCASRRQTPEWQTPLKAALQQKSSSCDESSMMAVPLARAELPRIKTGTNQPRSTAGEASEPGSDLGLVMVVASVVVVAMVAHGKRRTCKHHHKQGSSKNLLHSTNLA